MAYEPHESISCQELLQAEDAFSGWIRKQKRVFGKAFPAGGLWFRRYMIITGGCLYLYPDEYSKSPSGKFSLQFCKVDKVQKKEGYPPWCFSISSDDAKKVHYFSVASERELLDFTNHIMMSCTVRPQPSQPRDNKRKGDSSGIESGEENSGGSFIVPGSDNDEDNGSENEYEEVHEFAFAESTPPPRPPKTDSMKQSHSRPNSLCDPNNDLPHSFDDTKKQPFCPRSVPPVPPDYESPPFTLLEKHTSPDLKRTPSNKSERPLPPIPFVQKQTLPLPPRPMLQSPPKTVLELRGVPMVSDENYLDVVSDSPQGSQVSDSPQGSQESFTSSIPKKPFVAPKPPIAKKPTVQVDRHENFFHKRVFWPGSKEDANRYLEDKKEEGMYLIRHGSSGQTLVVYCGGVCRNYQIKVENNRYLITSHKTFASCEELVEYYSNEFLPNREFRLRKPYNS